MKLKKRLALLLVAVMITTLMPTIGFAEDMAASDSSKTAPVFTDMPNNWSTESLQNAVDNGLLKGDNGRLRPGDSLTRAEMASIINRAFGATVKATLMGYQDVSEKAWYYEEMGKVLQMGTFQGGGDGLLRPQDPITRQEVFVVMARAFKLSNGSEANLNGFADQARISSWAKPAAAALVDAGYIQGANGRLNPKENITRAEFAKIMDSMLTGYVNSPGTIDEVPGGNVMINVPGVTLKNLAVKGDLIIGDGVGEGNVSLENVTIAGRLVVRGGGENSILITGNSNVESIIIAKVKGKVRVFTADGTEIGEVLADGSDDVILEGNFSSITVQSNNIVVNAVKAEIGEARMEGNNSTLLVGAGSSVERVQVTGNNVTIEGSGNVDTVQVYSANVVVKTVNTAVTAETGSTGVDAAGSLIGTGETIVTKPPTIPSGGGGGTVSLPKVNEIIITTDPVDVTGVDNEAEVEVTLSTSTEGVTIFYTLNGHQPSSTSTEYIAPIKVATTNPRGETIVIKAIGMKAGMTNSNVAQKSMVFNLSDDQAAANVVDLMIISLPEINALSLIDKNLVEDARDAFDALSDNQKNLVTELSTLINAEAKITDLVVAESVVLLIGSLPAPSSLTLTDKPDVVAAREAYDGLTADQKALVTNLAILSAAESRIQELEADAAATAEANGFKTSHEAALALAVDTVQITDENNVETALTSYGTLSEGAKAKLAAEKTLLDSLKDKIDDLKQAAADQAAADAVMGMISSLPTPLSLSLADKSDVVAVRGAYDGLTADQKALVTNLATLSAAESRIQELEADAAATAEANGFKTSHEAVLALAVDTVQITDENNVETALTSYGTLSEGAKAKLAAEKTLLDSLKHKIDDLKQAAADQAAADAVMGVISSLPTPLSLSLADKPNVVAAREAYDGLTADQKALVTNLATLSAAESRIQELEADAAATAEANGFKTSYGAVLALAVDTVQITDENNVETALTSYGTLSEGAKAKLVAEKTLLDSLKDKIDDLKQAAADQAAADAVMGMISALPASSSLTLADKPDVVAAREAYYGLMADQKALVTNLATLSAAESKIIELEAIETANVDISTALGLVPDSFSAVEGTDSNLIDSINNISGMAATGVVISVESSNSNVANDGDITYSDTEVIGNVLIKIAKAPGSQQSKTITLTIPEAAPKVPNGDLIEAAAASNFTGVLFTTGGSIYYSTIDIAGNWAEHNLIGAGTVGSLAIDGSDKPHIAFVSGSAIAYTMFDGNGWTIPDVIESLNIGGSGSCTKPDIAVTSDGIPHITYTDSHGTSDDYSHPDIMHAVKGMEGFSISLICKGYRDYSSSGSWGADYFNKGSYIALNQNGDYFIITHRQSVWRWPNGTDNTYYISIKSNLGEGSISNYGSDSFDIFDIKAALNKIIVLYKNIGFNASELAISGGTINLTSTTGLTGTRVSTANSDGSSTVVGGLNNQNLLTHFDGTPTQHDGVSVKGNIVSIIYLNDTFYAIYTDSVDSNIKIVEVQ